MKIAFFKPFNIKRTNAFYSSEYLVFRYLQENYNYEMTYFIDDKSVKFDRVNMKYIEKNAMKELIFRGLKRVFDRYKYYWKIPCYKDLDFSEYDIIVTEGIHYLLLDYFKNIGDKVILNDSIFLDYVLSNNQIRYLNKYFDKSLAVVINDKIPNLYKGLKLNILTIGHAVDTNSIPFAERKECKGKLISAGRLVPEKGFEYIIRAIAGLKNKYPDIKLDIYGTGPLEGSLKNLIKSLDLENVVCLKGFLAHEKLMLNLKNYDLFVSHPLETSYIAEAFLMANIEAMANGLPVITSNCGGVPYVIRDRAIIVEQQKIGQIVRAIENFINNPKKVKDYSIRGRKYIEENYSVEIIARKWHRAIKEFKKT